MSTVRTRLAAAMLIGAGLPGLAAAQTASLQGPPMRVDAELGAILQERLKSDLRNLLTAQETYFVDHAAYGRTLSPTARGSVIMTPSAGVTVTLLHVEKAAYAARASHVWMPGHSCVVYVGAVDARHKPATERQRRVPADDGLLVCDDVPS